MSIKSPLQALEHIRALCVAPRPQSVAAFVDGILKAVEQGIAYAVPPAGPYRKAARDLVPGDVLVFGKTRSVVSFTALDAGRVSVPHVLLGLDEPVRVTSYAADSQFTVARLAPAGLTPVQASADRLLAALRQARDGLRCVGADTAAYDALLDELDPPKPPTLEEALAMVEVMARKIRAAGPMLAPDAVLSQAEALLARVPQ